jgi:hypothetical protein
MIVDREDRDDREEMRVSPLSPVGLKTHRALALEQGNKLVDEDTEGDDMLADMMKD